jgi:hypothetical protein
MGNPARSITFQNALRRFESFRWALIFECRPLSESQVEEQNYIYERKNHEEAQRWVKSCFLENHPKGNDPKHADQPDHQYLGHV